MNGLLSDEAVLSLQVVELTVSYEFLLLESSDDDGGIDAFLFCKGEDGGSVVAVRADEGGEVRGRNQKVAGEAVCCIFLLFCRSLCTLDVAVENVSCLVKETEPEPVGVPGACCKCNHNLKIWSQNSIDQGSKTQNLPIKAA